jgi:hypothetical protein
MGSQIPLVSKVCFFHLSSLQIINISEDDLRAFHAKHFPHSAAPEYILSGYSPGAAEEQYEDADAEDEEDELGWYPDGTKRTLTDAEIAILRHSEIQAILRKRRLAREIGNLSEEGEAASESPRTAASPVPAPTDPVQPDRAVPAAKQKWATSSARTKARNKRNRNRYKNKKREERLQMEREQKGVPLPREESEESDEWDARHQARGPDVQQDDTPALDY